jgi:hypothetical protein
MTASLRKNKGYKMQKPSRSRKGFVFLVFNDHFIESTGVAAAAALSVAAATLLGVAFSAAAASCATSATESAASWLASSEVLLASPQEAKPNRPAIIKTANNFFIFGLI